MSFTGRGIVVVGGTTAYGRAVTLAAAGRGAEVVFSMPAGSEAAAAEIERLTDGRATGVAADPSREDDAERLFGVATGRLPRIDVVVCAAPALPERRLPELTLSEWELGVASALRSAFFASRLAVEEFLAHGAGGRLVHVAPTVREGEPGQALAAASLQALLSLMRSTAKEYGPRGICCNAVVPAAREGPAAEDRVAETALFLASAEASYVNGEAVRLAGAAS